MSLDSINEAFRSLEMLNEDVFSTDPASLNDLSDFMDTDEQAEEEVSVIDPEAESEDDIQKSYVGKVILDCNICHSLCYKDKNDISVDIDGNVNVDEDCPYCGEHNGFVIKGEVVEYQPEEEVAEEPVEEPAAEEPELDDELEEKKPEEELTEDLDADEVEEVTEVITEESNMDKLRRAFPELNEGFNNVSIETENERMTMTSEDSGKVTVTTEPLDTMPAETGEVIAPVSPEVESEILASAEVEEEIPEEMPAEEEFVDEEIDEVDEEGVNELGESYLKRVYENVESFKTSSISATPTKLIIEGVINFKSGAKKNTGFIFEAKDATKDGQLRFVGENAHLSRGKKAFTMTGRLNDKKLMVESFTYNYRAKNSEGNSTRVYGTINRNK